MAPSVCLWLRPLGRGLRRWCCASISHLACQRRPQTRLACRPTCMLGNPSESGCGSGCMPLQRFDATGGPLHNDIICPPLPASVLPTHGTDPPHPHPPPPPRPPGASYLPNAKAPKTKIGAGRRALTSAVQRGMDHAITRRSEKVLARKCSGWGVRLLRSPMCSQPVFTGGPGAGQGLWDINIMPAKFQRHPRENYTVKATQRHVPSAPRLAS